MFSTRSMYIIVSTLLNRPNSRGVILSFPPYYTHGSLSPAGGLSNRIHISHVHKQVSDTLIINVHFTGSLKLVIENRISQTTNFRVCFSCAARRQIICRPFPAKLLRLRNLTPKLIADAARRSGAVALSLRLHLTFAIVPRRGPQHHQRRRRQQRRTLRTGAGV